MVELLNISMPTQNKITDVNFHADETKETIAELKKLLSKADAECKIQIYSLYLASKNFSDVKVRVPQQENPMPIEPKPIQYSAGIDLELVIFETNREKQTFSYNISDNVTKIFESWNSL